MDRKELLKILASVKPGVASKEIIESMTYFYFSGSDIVTYNDQISIQHPMKTDFNLFVKANDFYKVAEKSKAETIEMSEKDDKLLIKAGKLRASLATIFDEDIVQRIDNVTKSLEDVKWKKLPKNFIECVSLCSFAASKSESDQTLTCIKIDALDCAATDNRRIAHAVLDSKMKSMFLKATEVNNLISIEPTHYSISKAWLHFKNKDRCIFSIRKVKGDFPDCLPMFDFEGDKVKLPKSILEGMDLTAIFSDESSPNVELNISNGSCLVSVQSESGKAKFKTKIKYTGNDIVFRINPDFLKEMMKHSTTLVISEDKAKLETENFALVTALFD